MSALDFVGLLALCSVIAWVFLWIVADIICPSDRVRDLRERRELREPVSEWRPVYDHDHDDE